MQQQRPTIPTAPVVLRLVSVVMAVLVLAFGITSTAQAALSSASASNIADAIAGPLTVVDAASFESVPGGIPNGVGDSALSFFPTNGTTFGVLTTGSLAAADDPNSSGSTGTNLGGGNVRGDTDQDVTILRLDLNVPTGANCLSFSFAFYSEEFPEWVGTAYNDAFIAELDVSNWTTSGSTIAAPNNFAFDPLGNPITINAAGVTSMTAANGAGTTYDAGTPLLSASTPVTPGSHSLYLSIFDQGDGVYDSAVFLDDLVVGFVPNPDVNCVPGAQPVLFDLDLTPDTASKNVGDLHEVEATLLDAATSAPISGASIDFEVTGANAASGSGVTDASGVATFSYTGTVAGSDTIAASYDADASPPAEATASATADWNTPPVADANGPYLTAVNVPVALDGNGSNDPDGDALTFNWTAAIGTIATPASPTPTFTHDTAGIYTATLQVCDPLSACDSDDATVVVYDPSAGFVTGGGWIDSSSGSCGPAAPTDVCVEDATGRANFGFVAKYKMGANVPDGQTEFMFRDGNLNFHSTAYSWLVVAGKDLAQFKGTGTINGVPGFEFMLTAYDGKADGDVDGFRIRITDGSGGLVYDNRADAGDGAATKANTQGLSGGSIVIHTK